MRLFELSLAAAVAFGMTGCEQRGAEAERTVAPGVTVSGSEGNETVTMRSETGDAVVVRSGTAVGAAEGPAFAQPYPGATVSQSVSAGNGSGQMIVFTTSADPATVIAYYRERAEEAGLTSGASLSMGDTQMYGADAEGGGNLSVMVAPANGQSSVTVTWTDQG